MDLRCHLRHQLHAHQWERTQFRRIPALVHVLHDMVRWWWEAVSDGWRSTGGGGLGGVDE